MATTFKATRDDIIRVVGSGVEATDNARFAAAVAAANAHFTNTLRAATIVIERDVSITTTHTFTSPTNLTCTPGSWLIRAGEPDVNGILPSKIKWGNDPVPFSASSLPISNLAAGDSSFTLTGSPPALDKSEYILIVGDNNITGHTPHTGGTNSRPVEMHRVARAVLGQTNQYVFGDTVDEPFTTSPRIVRLIDAFKPLSGIRVYDFNMRTKVGSPPTFYALEFGNCVDLTLYNVQMGYPLPGAMLFSCCMNVRRHGINYADLEDYNTYASGVLGNSTDTVYGIIDRVVNGMDIKSCKFGSQRHGYTTAAYGDTPSSSRYGCVKNVLIDGNRWGTNGLQGTSSPYTWASIPQCDTHTEGRRITITNNEFNIPGEAAVSNTGVNIRARDVMVRNNTFNTSKYARPVVIQAKDATIANNTFNGGLYCQVVNSGTNANVDNVRWIGNTFSDFFGPAIEISTGTNHEITGNTFRNCGTAIASNTPAQAAIYVASLTNSSARVRIVNNYIPKGSNVQAIAFGSTVNANQFSTICGNHVDGYGAWDMGIRSPQFRTGEVVTTSQVRRAGGYEYRATTGFTTGAAPVHTTPLQTVDNWTYIRPVNGAKIAELEMQFAQYNGVPGVSVFSKSAHGFTRADAYAMLKDDLSGKYDDTSGANATAGVMLLDVIDEAHFVAAEPGAVIPLPISVYVGASDPALQPRTWYWDLSASGYVAAKPGDSHASAPVVLTVGSYFTSTQVQARLSYFT